MQKEQGTSCYINICGEMERWVAMFIWCPSSTATWWTGYRYLKSMAQDIKDVKLKHHGLRGIFCIYDFRDTIQAYRRHIADLKMDFVVRQSLPDFLCSIWHSNVDPFSWWLPFWGHTDAQPVEEYDGSSCCMSLRGVCVSHSQEAHCNHRLFFFSPDLQFFPH